MTRPEAVDAVAALVGGDPAPDQAAGTPTVDVAATDWVAALGRARDGGYVFFDWLTAVDLVDEGFAVVTHLYDPAARAHLLLRVRLPREASSLATATTVFPGADWHERETAEMFGLVFAGHPDPRPLLLADDFAGHPLRKDFVLAARASREWPGATDPTAARPRRRAPAPPGVPGPGAWPDETEPR
jgi:NADH-quinone oxidoreductase subunit C